MNFCANDACPYFEHFASRAEYVDEIGVCRECGQDLTSGEAPPIVVETRWVDQVCIQTFLNSAQAYVARAKLADLGIPAEISDQYLVGADWLYSAAIGGVKLYVPAEQAEAARDALLEEDEEALADIPESALPPDPDEICPRCGTAGALPSSRTNRWRALSLLFTLPLINWRHWQKCPACGNQWPIPRHAMP